MLIAVFGCNSSKEFFKSTADSTSVIKIDSGAIKSIAATETKDIDWGKEVIIYPPVRDCTIHNYYPTAIIREWGKDKTKTEIISKDSGWKSKADSLQVVNENLIKKSETQVMNIWHIVGLCVGIYLLLWGVSKLKISFR